MEVLSFILHRSVSAYLRLYGLLTRGPPRAVEYLVMRVVLNSNAATVNEFLPSTRFPEKGGSGSAFCARLIDFRFYFCFYCVSWSARARVRRFGFCHFLPLLITPCL